MMLCLKKAFLALDGSNRETIRGAVIPAGKHKVVRIPDPYGRPNRNWIVLEGTVTGKPEDMWETVKKQQKENDPEVVIVE